MSRVDKEVSRSKKKNKRMAASDSGFRFKSGKEFKDGFKKSGLLKRADGLLGGMDYITLALVIALTIFGIAMIFSASYYTTVNLYDDALYYLKRQLVFVIIGLGALLVFYNIDYHVYYKYGRMALIVSLTLLVLVLLIGIEVNGAKRWLGYGSARITPSELSKLLMIIWTSVFMAADPDNVKGKRVLIPFAVMTAHFILIEQQPNLSTAIVILLIMVAIMFVAGLHYGWLGAGMLAGTLLCLYILNFKKGTHWYSRLTNWRNPFADSQGEGYQVSQSIIALGNGGASGQGFGNSIAKTLYLPEPQNDFILAVIGEELGFLGFVILMMVYLLLLYRLIRIALRAKDRLGFYLATGVAAMLGLQLMINIAVVTASMPATGITLPFVSYGGSSIIVFMAAIGISLNVARNRNEKKVIN